mmetsp:Transcript_37906/g.97864  ORF Transcript_37906/g.97864 Transcript_37906/m.97864 type:complete len:119 (-) Transcript_37906:1248-1604(-)
MHMYSTTELRYIIFYPPSYVHLTYTYPNFAPYYLLPYIHTHAHSCSAETSHICTHTISSTLASCRSSHTSILSQNVKKFFHRAAGRPSMYRTNLLLAPCLFSYRVTPLFKAFMEVVTE